MFQEVQSTQVVQRDIRVCRVGWATFVPEMRTVLAWNLLPPWVCGTLNDGNIPQHSHVVSSSLPTTLHQSSSSCFLLGEEKHNSVFLVFLFGALGETEELYSLFLMGNAAGRIPSCFFIMVVSAFLWLARFSLNKFRSSSSFRTWAGAPGKK